MPVQTPVRLSLTEVRVLAHLAVEERGADYVYPRTLCVYFVPDETDEATGVVTGYCPSCLVGWIIAARGITRDDLRLSSISPARNWAGDVNDEGVDALIEAGIIQVAPDTQRYLLRLQQVQDNGHSWGAALREAERPYPPLGYALDQV